MDPAWNAVLLVGAALSLVWLAGLAGFAGGLVLIVRTARRRAQLTSSASTRGA